MEQVAAPADLRRPRANSSESPRPDQARPLGACLGGYGNSITVSYQRGATNWRAGLGWGRRISTPPASFGPAFRDSRQMSRGKVAYYSIRPKRRRCRNEGDAGWCRGAAFAECLLLWDISAPLPHSVAGAREDYGALARYDLPKVASNLRRGPNCLGVSAYRISPICGHSRRSPHLLRLRCTRAAARKKG